MSQASISAMNIQSYHKDGSSFPILEDVDLVLVYERTICDVEHLFPAQKVSVDIPKVGIILNRDQLNLAIDLYKQFSRKPENKTTVSDHSDAKVKMISVAVLTYSSTSYLP
jgi:hypothetical protein